ncbi:MAG: PEP-CTERM/exosortase system-associated acyltransferase [Gammaproteobacteria bacterium]|nr:PEP-CTERM/exosortase system-associated acyltransferase [Gammaproteobacteria bacterium]
MFDEKYQILRADTEEAQRLHYRLRCEIYCVDRSFESSNNFPTGEEVDEADERALHFIIIEKASQEWIGVFRVVLPDHEKLPIEQYCVMDSKLIKSLPRDKTAEISRLGIARRFTQRTPEHENESELAQTKYVIKNLKEVTLGIWRALVQLSEERGIEDYLFFITPALARVLLGLHAPLLRAGLPCEHRGTRHPYLLNLEKDAERIKHLPRKEMEFIRSRPGYFLYSENAELYTTTLDYT